MHKNDQNSMQTLKVGSSYAECLRSSEHTSSRLTNIWLLHITHLTSHHNTHLIAHHITHLIAQTGLITYKSNAFMYSMYEGEDNCTQSSGGK